MPATARISSIVIDCAAPGPLAEFYRALTGWEITYSDADFIFLGDGGPVQLGLQRVAGYLPPRWPDPAKQAHLDLKAADVPQAIKEALAAGAGRPDFQPGGDDWVVLTDPEGHPFCLAAE